MSAVPGTATDTALHRGVRVALVFAAALGCSSAQHAAPRDAGSTSSDAAQPAASDAGVHPRDATVPIGAPDAAARDSGVDASPAHDANTVPDSGGLDTGIDASAPAPKRPRLATTGAQLRVTGERLGLQLTRANLSDDTDVFAVHLEFYGIPWAAFENDTAPPAEWAALMREFADHAQQAARPVFLSINMLNGARERLAATTRIESGQVKTNDATTATCYDFATASDRASKREAYLRYVDFMLDLFEPEYLNFAIEVNLFFEKCAAATPGLIAFMNSVYEHAKAKRPTAAVFPSFQIDHLYGYSKDSCPDQNQRDTCFDAHYAQLKGIMRDRFAISSYPFLNGITSTSALPADWFARAPQRGAERALIAETGWLATPLTARGAGSTCTTVFSFSEADSAAYLSRVLSDAKRLDLELVTWWSDRDLVTSELMTDCPCDFDTTWCSVLDIFRGPAVPGMPNAQFYGEVLLKAFGSMGLRHYDGSPRTAHMAAWNAARP